MQKIMVEIWKYINGSNDVYKISSHGRVKSMARIVPFRGSTRSLKEKIMKPQIERYCKVLIQINGKLKFKRIHRIVANYFISNPENKPEVNHIDGDKLNNHISNLEWCTSSENMKHAYRTKLTVASYGALNPMAILDDESVIVIRNRFKNGDSVRDITNGYPVSIHCIRNIVNGRNWKHLL